MNYIDMSVTDRCINPDSYGEICTACNMCGRIARKEMWQARYNHYADELADLTGKLRDDFYQSNSQQENIAANIVYVGKKLRDCMKHMEFRQEAE